jgi:hypothetical protein
MRQAMTAEATVTMLLILIIVRSLKTLNHEMLNQQRICEVFEAATAASWVRAKIVGIWGQSPLGAS